MSVAFALISAFSYGISDFLGGIFARRVSAWQIAVVGQTSSAVCAFTGGLFLRGTPTDTDWVWGAVAGLGGGVGAAFLYRGLSTGRMSVVAPISAIGAALVPVAIGLLTGDRPALLAWVGVACALPAIYLISRMSDDPAAAQRSGGVLDGVLAGLGFGSLFAGLGQVGAGAGLMPLAMAQLTSVASVILSAVALRSGWVPRSRHAWKAAAMGPLGATATGFFLYATHHGLLTVVSVIASLYPATTVVLAAVLLREQIHRTQAVGLGLAAAAVSLVAAA
ncbi:MAG: EamA family transporter [Nocardioidaceae bacterium]